MGGPLRSMESKEKSSTGKRTKRINSVALLKILRYFDNLHGDPRFNDLVKRVGIPD
jgi:hypothetical protein